MNLPLKDFCWYVFLIALTIPPHLTTTENPTTVPHERKTTPGKTETKAIESTTHAPITTEAGATITGDDQATITGDDQDTIT